MEVVISEMFCMLLEIVCIYIKQ